MDNIPKELEETQLNLHVVIDPATKCVTMKTHTEEFDATNTETVPPDIIPNDPLHYPQPEEKDLEKMSELDRLIYEERQRLLNLKRPRKPIIAKRRRPKDKSSNSDQSETDTSWHELTQNQKSKLRMRKLRERETSEERDLRRFRHRINTNKVRLLQKLRNFEDETFLKEITKRSTDRIKQKRLELKAKETPEERAMRKSQVSSRSRLAKIRRKAFRTPEELLEEKEKRSAYMEKFWSRHTKEQRRARQKASRERAKKRHQKNNNEWKKVEMIIKGAPLEREEVGVKSEIVEKI